MCAGERLGGSWWGPGSWRGGKVPLGVGGYWLGGCWVVGCLLTTWFPVSRVGDGHGALALGLALVLDRGRNTWLLRKNRRWWRRCGPRWSVLCVSTAIPGLGGTGTSSRRLRCLRWPW